MSVKSRIRNFTRKYSAKSILERIEKLIEYIQKSIQNTGNSFYKLFLILLLLSLISFKSIGLFIKNISDEIARILKSIWNFITKFWDKFVELLKYVYENFLEVLDLIWQFIRKVFFLTVVEEVGFYFKKLKDYSKELKETLTIIVQKLQDYSDYLNRKFENKNLAFTSTTSNSYLSLSGNAIVWFLITTAWSLLTLTMTLILVLGTIIGIPVLHQFIRKDIIGNNEE